MSEGKTDWQTQKEEQAKKRKIQNRVKKIEAEIESLEEKLTELDEQFQDPAVADQLCKTWKTAQRAGGSTGKTGSAVRRMGRTGI